MEERKANSTEFKFIIMNVLSYNVMCWDDIRGVQGVGPGGPSRGPRVGDQNQSKLGALRTPPTPITKHTYTPLDDILVRILSSSVQ